MRATPRVLVVGGDGWIGRALATRFHAKGYETLATTRRRAEVGEGRPFLDLAAFDPRTTDLPKVDSAIICAAVARLRDCAADPVGSAGVNVEGTLRLARYLANRGGHVVLLSTDKVFDGRLARRAREDAVSPITEYGRQKASAEAGIRDLGNLGAILRLSKVLDSGEWLVAEWMATLRRGRVIRPYRDMYLAPVLLPLVAALLEKIVERRGHGIYQASGERDLSYADFARKIARLLGAPEHLIEPIAADSSQHPKEVRPPNSSLEMSREWREFDLAQPTIDDVTPAVVDQACISAA